MISFSDARKQVMEQVKPITDIEQVAVADALGRVLAAPAKALIDVPNHDNSAMDGYGVRFKDLSLDQPVGLEVIADLPAGDRLTKPLGGGEAVRIMTGAPIPDGCDCIVIQEVVTWEAGGQLMVPPGQKKAQHIRRAGEDIAKGEKVLPAGRRLGPADLGLLTSLGLVEVACYRKPRVALLSTGNEVVEAGTPLKPGQVYDSNRSSLRGALQSLGVDIIDLGLVQDDRKAITDILARGGEEADAVISTGGVSVGDYDLIKEVLINQGQIHFWKVSMKPGKPQAYGRLGKALFFGLPGNPVSGLVVFLLMVRPALIEMMGATPEPERILRLPFKGSHRKKHGRMDFVRGVVHFDGRKAPWVETTGPQGSGILTSMSKANAFIVLPEGPVKLKDGDEVSVLMIDYG
ncbi:MAG: molybdopterin molybdotransferase MoeA [Magnetococcales bacterium]|nr:molybdopterin molybdotransferase MoeA [Magnetococcales bacterium]